MTEKPNTITPQEEPTLSAFQKGDAEALNKGIKVVGCNAKANRTASAKVIEEAQKNGKSLW